MIVNDFNFPNENNTLSQYPGETCSTHRGKCQMFKNFPGWNQGVSFLTWETTKATDGDIKTQPVELTKILRLLKNIIP